jgi:hypothetical protein
MLASDQTDQTLGLVNLEPVVDCIGIAGLEQTVPSDPVRAFAGGNLQHRRTAFAHEGTLIAVAMVDERLALCFSQL